MLKNILSDCFVLCFVQGSPDPIMWPEIGRDHVVDNLIEI